MPRFQRLEPDGSRGRGIPPFSAANENAKTELIESALMNSGADTVNAANGTHHADRLRALPVVLFMVRSITDMGGGRYLGCAYDLNKIEWWQSYDQDLIRDFLATPPNYDTVEIWSLSEIMGNASGHMLINDPDVGQIGIGVLVEQGEGLPIVLMVDTLPWVARMIVNTVVSADLVTASIYNGVDMGDVSYNVQTASLHLVGDEILATRPLGGVRGDPVVGGLALVWEEIGGSATKQVTVITSMRVVGTTKKIQVKTRLVTVVDPVDGSDNETDWIDIHTGVGCTTTP